MSTAPACSTVIPLPLRRPESTRLTRAAAGQAAPGPLQAWIATQIRVLEFWREDLIAQGGEWRLIALLDQHAAFLKEAGEL